ncbi:hypothetical protein TNCT_235001 [Trichonephila clavata]|uniref:Uncharacterized protein n=1 Tax=Trichonephila clavata TaxID=2740835 RepID=A0A8X6GI87_TRICU|nr:hypothetical protein TNCT_235001 [Trichonephila clavata]
MSGNTLMSKKRSEMLSAPLAAKMKRKRYHCYRRHVPPRINHKGADEVKPLLLFVPEKSLKFPFAIPDFLKLSWKYCCRN